MTPPILASSFPIVNRGAHNGAAWLITDRHVVWIVFVTWIYIIVLLCWLGVWPGGLQPPCWGRDLASGVSSALGSGCDTRLRRVWSFLCMLAYRFLSLYRQTIQLLLSSLLLSKSSNTASWEHKQSTLSFVPFGHDAYSLNSKSLLQISRTTSTIQLMSITITCHFARCRWRSRWSGRVCWAGIE